MREFDPHLYSNSKALIFIGSKYWVALFNTTQKVNFLGSVARYPPVAELCKTLGLFANKRAMQVFYTDSYSVVPTPFMTAKIQDLINIWVSTASGEQRSHYADAFVRH